MSIELAKKIAWTVLLQKGNDFNQTRQQVKGFYARGRPICDREMLDEVKALPPIHTMIHNHTMIPTFEDKFSDWIIDNMFNNIKGLESYQPDISQGATQSFDSFYIKHGHKKIKMFFGEYLYHIVVRQKLNMPYDFIKSYDELQEGDALVISVPFCDTGNIDFDLDKIFKHCDTMNIPVLLDCAYFPIAYNIEIDLNYECIDTVCFSLSKLFPIAHARVGMRYTKKGFEDGQRLHSNINYDNRISAGIGLHFIDKFRSDHVVEKYILAHKKFIKAFGLKPSNTILFADGDDTWIEYGRHDILKAYGLEDDWKQYHNRLCFTELYENLSIAEEVINVYN